MASVFAVADTHHAEILMEGSGLKTYRQKMLAEKQQHDWEMKLLEKERRIAWNSDRVEQGRLRSRLENINKRILEINKSNSTRQNLQTRAMLLLDNDIPLQNMASQNLGKIEKNTFISRRPFLSSGDMRQTDVFQDSYSGVLKQGGLDSKSGKSLETTVPGCHLPLVYQKTISNDRQVYNGSTLGDSQLADSKNLPSIKKRNQKASLETAQEEANDSVKPRLVRRKSMDPQLLASLLNVDESSVQKQSQVFQRAKLNSDAALRVNSADDTKEKSEENRRQKKLQRRASIASMHMPSDLIKLGFPELRSGAQLSPKLAAARGGASDKDFPASASLVSRARRSSLPSVSTTNDGKFTKLGLTAARRKSIGPTPKTRASSLEKLENVIEESEEHLHNTHREETMKNLIQSVMSIDCSFPLSLRKKEQWGQ